MKTHEVEAEALSRAVSGQSAANYTAIVEGFTARGIAPADIRPRENVFTFHAWKALGRIVKRGEKGIAITTWVPIADTVDQATGERKTGRVRPMRAYVFHVSQTVPLNAEG